MELFMALQISVVFGSKWDRVDRAESLRVKCIATVEAAAPEQSCGAGDAE